MTETDETFEARPWVYAGRALDAKNQLVERWHTHVGEVAVFGKTKHRSIGSTYLVECTEDGARARIKSAQYVMPDDDRAVYLGDDRDAHTAIVDGWKANDAAAWGAYQAIAAERKVKADHGGDFGGLTIKQYAGLIARAGSPQKRAALITALLAYVNG